MGELDLLWQRYAARRTPELRRQLIEAYAPLARYVVERMNLRPGPALGYDDLLSQAVVGLIDAVDRFDPARGVRFESYAYHRIRGAVMDMLREMDWLPRSLRQRESQLAATYARLEDELGRAPTDEEVARALGVTLEALDEMARELALQSVQSLDEALGRRGRFVADARQEASSPESGALGDAVADPAAPSPEAEAERRAERELLAEAIAQLPETERTVVSLYYYEGLTLKEIGRMLGFTESRACQIHGKAILRLRAYVQPRVAEQAPAAPEARQVGPHRPSIAAGRMPG